MPPAGKLFYVVGPSGAGKDSLLGYVRERLPADAPVMFAHRYITRPAAAGGENHVALSESEFHRLVARGLLAMHWGSHGLRYGLGTEIDRWLSAGLDVVMNGSRAYLTNADQRYGDALQVVSITVETSILRARLEERGRESPAEVEQRLTRAAAFNVDHPGTFHLANNGSLAEAGERLLELLADRVAAH